MEKIKVISLQFEPVRATPKASCQKAYSLLEENNVQSADLIVLPEFFNVGINFTNDEFKQNAETEKISPSLSELSLMAKKYNTYILCGSILFKEKDKYFNRSYLLDRKGNIVTKYDKIHLFNYFGGNEGTYTYPGDKTCIAKTDFGTIGLATCFDLRYPEHFLKLIKMGAEIITLPAAWSIVNHATQEYRTQHFANWRTMNIARALDNVSYFISANLCGNIHPMFKGMGHSMIVDYNGNVIAEAEESKEMAICNEINLTELRKTRKTFPVHLL